MKFAMRPEQEQDLRDWHKDNNLPGTFEEWLNEQSPHEVLKAYLHWNGIIHYTAHIEAAMEMAYGIRLPR